MTAWATQPLAKAAAARAVGSTIFPISFRKYLASKAAGSAICLAVVAEEAGANKRMLYYHVGNKEDLYLAVLEGTYEKIRAEERTLKGCYMGSCVPRRDIDRYLALHAAGRLPVDRLVTGHLTLDQINEGFDRLARGEAIRQIIRMEA